jgi:hypothetical protein
MPTLEEILNENLGNVNGKQENEKTASTADVTDELEKLALELGLVETETETEPQQTKEAEMSLSKLYDDLFPEDVTLNEKVASVEDDSMEKQAAYEEAVGARAYDYFSARVDARLEKIAEAAMSEDSEPAQQLENNKAGGNSAIGTSPKVHNDLPADSGPEVVGKEQQKAAALRKHMLLSMLEE